MKKHKWHPRKWKRRKCRKMKTIRVENFERLSNTVGDKYEFAGEFIVTLIFDEGLETESTIQLYITNDGKAAITDVVVKAFGQVDQFLAPKTERWTNPNGG